MSDCTVYIDEAGDLGIGRGTKWFVLSAVIVEKSAEPAMRSTMDQIKARLNIREIHLRRILDYNKRAYLVKEPGNEPFTYMNVLVDTTKFDSAKIPDTNVAYNYMCKYLLQRVSWYLESNNMVGDIVLSARGTSRDGELIKYIREKLLPYPDNAINATAFDKVTAKAAASWDLLQLADVCATTMFLAYEVNGYGFCTPSFSMALQDHLYQKHNQVDTYGIKFFQKNMKPNADEMRKCRVCTKKEPPARLPHDKHAGETPSRYSGDVLSSLLYSTNEGMSTGNSMAHSPSHQTLASRARKSAMYHLCITHQI